MRKYIAIFMMLATLTVNAQKKSFTNTALDEVMMTTEGTEINFSDILNTYKGKPIVISIWEGLCSDCVKGIPKINKLQKKYGNIVFLYLSLDETTENWKKSIKTFKGEGEHYYIKSGWKGAFCSSINLERIPRYMIVSPRGEILLYKATKASDPKIETILKEYEAH